MCRVNERQNEKVNERLAKFKFETRLRISALIQCKYEWAKGEM